ncbi:hypothetical protein KIH39_11850 [Telmatocola sphagniphila]|uniref:Uncharacterized protein n=1 Tax=Telmatocola sphagniphila TaxID=1123043 RepID=A0A8E6BCV2_9BACT|nr:hypothetical protein [Telmatocola sphagniphila]QVL34565.1 hypothetical protein KIH39_11850 [Telmatocola sphagniphila]
MNERRIFFARKKLEAAVDVCVVEDTSVSWEEFITISLWVSWVLDAGAK